MDIKSEIRDFLTSRRARITPEEAGLKSFGQRRVPGLRREAVATLAGLSIEYYNRLERGNLGGASDSVLDVFLNREASEIYTDWDRAAKDTVALLRLEAGRNPHDRALTNLIGELATHSEEFRVLWAAHNVRLQTKGVKRLNHPIVGELELSFERLDVTADSGLMLVVYTAEPGSRSAESLDLLASWAASEAEGLAPSDPGARGPRSDLR